MHDNFSLADMATAVSTTKGKAKHEASGGITCETLRPIAETGVDFISIGALTKDCKALDLSLRLI
jgi:nicotinate-nucleotide pyrophosphorylase (carboxylating)